MSAWEDYDAEIQRFVDEVARHRRRMEKGGVAAQRLAEEIRSDSADIRRRVQELRNTADGWRRSLGLAPLPATDGRHAVRFSGRDTQHRAVVRQLLRLDEVRDRASVLAGAAIGAKERSANRTRAAQAAERAVRAGWDDVELERRADRAFRRLMVAAAATVVVALAAAVTANAIGGNWLEATAAPFAVAVVVGYSISSRLSPGLAALVAAGAVLLVVVLADRPALWLRIVLLVALVAAVVAGVVGLFRAAQPERLKRPAPKWSLLLEEP